VYFSNDVMAGGAAECDNGHQFCIQCAVTSTAKDFGIRHLKWSSSIHQALTWSQFTCCVCGTRGPLRRSSVTDAAVAALSVRCGFTALGLTCRWSGRRDQFDTHQHVFTDPVQDQPDTQDHPPRRGRMRLNYTDSDEANGQRVKRRRYQVGGEENEDEVASQRVQAIHSDVVSESAFRDFNASGESVDGVALDTTIPRCNRAGVIISAAAVADDADDDDDDVHDDGGGGCIGRREDELHIRQEETLTIQTAVRGRVGLDPDDGSADISRDADWEETAESLVTPNREFQPSQSPTASDVREPVIPTDLRGSEVFQDVDGQARELDIIPGQFHTVHSALQNAGLVPEPTMPPVDRAAKLIYNITARAVRRVIKTFKPSAS